MQSHDYVVDMLKFGRKLTISISVDEMIYELFTP